MPAVRRGLRRVRGQRALHRHPQRGAQVSSDWSEELETKAIRRFAKISQSRRRPPSRPFSWLKEPTSAFTFKTLCLTVYVDVKLGWRHNDHNQ